MKSFKQYIIESPIEYEIEDETPSSTNRPIIGKNVKKFAMMDSGVLKIVRPKKVGSVKTEGGDYTFHHHTYMSSDPFSKVRNHHIYISDKSGTIVGLLKGRTIAKEADSKSEYIQIDMSAIDKPHRGRGLYGEAIKSFIGKTGFWENENETYPDLPEYDSSAIGGQNLRGLKVRHHRMPSVNFMANLYAGESVTDYGIDKLDQLGIIAENVVIPVELQPFVKSWFLSYAQRSANDCTVLGQSAVNFQSTSLQTIGGKHYPDTWSSGLNTIFINGDGIATLPVTPYCINARGGTCNEAILRFYDLNLLVNQPDIAPMYISNELFYDVGMDWINVSNAGGNTTDNKASFATDFVLGRSSPAQAPTVNRSTVDGVNVRYRRVTDYKYLANQVIDGRYYNQIQEDCLILNIDCTIDSNAVLPDGTVIAAYNTYADLPDPVVFGEGYAVVITTGDLYESDGTSWTYVANRTKGSKSLPVNTGVQVLGWGNSASWTGARNQSYLTTLMANPNNLYRLTSQKLVSTSEIRDVTQTTCVTYNGDGFVTYNSYHVAGWGGTSFNNLYNPSNKPENLVRGLVNSLVISHVNNQLRSSDSTVSTKQFYPKYGTYWSDIKRDVIEINKLYNNDYNSINNLVSLQPYNPSKRTVDENFYRINRTAPAASESTDINWRTWLVNDYYESPRNKGKIINIEGEDRDLLIQMEKATFKTVGNEQLNIDTTTAFVGAGNIFERPAIEFIPSKEGTFGTQHRFSCRLTRFGYISVDAESARITIIAGTQPIHISDETMYRWLVENLAVNYKVNYAAGFDIDVYEDNPYFGKGIHVGVDYQFDRLFITKKDYELTELGRNAVIAGLLTYNSGRWLLENFTTGGITEITEADSPYFTDLSWTMVYEINSKAFTFFQSYLPNKFINSRFKSIAIHTKPVGEYKSCVSRAFLMNQLNKGVYDNTVNIDVDSPVTETATPYDFYIVPVFGAGKNSIELINVQLQNEVVDATELLGSIATYPQETASHILVFNSYQSTDVTELIPFGNNSSNYFLYNIRNIKGVWMFNRIYDLLNSANYNSGVPFINNFSELDSTKLDLAKAFYNKLPLIDQWIAVKIIYTNSLQNTKEFRILQVNISALPVQR